MDAGVITVWLPHRQRPAPAPRRKKRQNWMKINRTVFLRVVVQSDGRMSAAAVEIPYLFTP